MFHNGMPLLFHTRREARQYRDKHYGYIRHRKDLRQEPHGWRLPVPVRVHVTLSSSVVAGRGTSSRHLGKRITALPLDGESMEWNE